ncbi:MAG: TIM-barrel domain-containing protein, partial [Chitinivibrionales bacterium]
GQTVFPDFSTEEGRAVWGRWVEEFARTGFHAAWIDMNDPSTGRIQCTDMLFEKGSKPHETYHNLYGSLMARATREGFEAVWPDQRVFLLSRSGFTGAQQYAAHWTGDNFSNYFHLRHCIGKSINLALSGMPFNGPDVGGFGGDATPGLMIDWIKACFLFPFFRNHCAQNRVRQEPWMLGEEVLEISRTFTRLRYKLLPYLYNLFVNQEKTGEAILRPLMYDFDDTTQVALGTVDTQHMVGPSIMQAPFVEEGASKREIVLPQALWYRADWGRWIEGNGVIETPKDLSTTPIFIRDGAIIPMQQGIRTSNRNDLHTIELLLCISPDFSGTARYTYAADDGISFAYYNGKRSVYTIEVTREGLSLHLLIHQESDNAGGVRFTPVTVHKFEKLVVESESGKKQKKRKKHSNVYFGAELTWFWWEQDGNTIKTEQVLTTALE